MDQHQDQDRGSDRAELLSEWTRPVDGRAVSRGRQTRRLAISTPGAFLAGMLVAALAVGAALRPGATSDPAGASGPGQAGAAANGSTGEPGAFGGLGDTELAAGGQPGFDGEAGYLVGRTPEPDPTKEPATPDPTKEPATPDPTKEPEPAPTPKPTPVPATAKPTTVPTISIALSLKDSHPYVSWGACDGVSFDYYKLVRSTDSTATWPAGSGDTVVAAVQPGATRAAWDSSAPAGKKLYYRVFCVQSTSTGYKAVRSSAVKGIDTPTTNPPTACSISLSGSLIAATMTTTPTGPGVSLDWTNCASDGLVYYKVVRSAGPNPSYLPWTDGTVLIAVVDPAGVTAYVDHPGSGTWYFRVQAIGMVDGVKAVLGQTAVVSVTVP